MLGNDPGNDPVVHGHCMAGLIEFFGIWKSYERIEQTSPRRQKGCAMVCRITDDVIEALQHCRLKAARRGRGPIQNRNKCPPLGGESIAFGPYQITRSTRMHKVSIYCGGSGEMPSFIVTPGFCETDHFIICSNFRASPNRA